MQIYSSRLWEERNLITGGGFTDAILLPVDQQYRGWQMQRICQALQVIQTDITLTTLNSADVGAVQSTLFGELFLAPAVQAAKITYIARQDVAGILFHSDVQAEHPGGVFGLRLPVPGRLFGRRQLIQKQHGVHARIIQAHAPVQMGPCYPSGFPHRANHVPARNGLTGFHVDA